MKGAAGLALAILAAILILDVALDVWRQIDGVQRARQRRRDNDAMRRELDRHRTPDNWRR